MRIFRLEDMKRGWFIGNFEPSLLRTECCEVAVKYYSAGDCEKAHFHKIATEYTVVVKGCIRMFDKEFDEGAIIVVEPGDITDFIAITDSINVVVKIPGISGDKYLVEE